MDKNPYIFYLLFLIIGIFLGDFLLFNFYFLISILGILFTTLFFIRKNIKLRITFSILLFIFWTVLGTTLVKINSFLPLHHYIYFKEDNAIQFISVTVKEQGNSNSKSRKYVAEVNQIANKDKFYSTCGDVLLLVDKEKFNSVLTLGNQYDLLVELKDPIKPLNPHQFNYSQYLQQQYILQMADVKKILSITPHQSILYKIKNLNQRVVEKINHSNLSKESKEFLKAYLLGDRFEMDKNTLEAYSQSGIMHLIAISGMHIAFIFSIIFSVFHLCLGRKRRTLVIIISLFFVWLFAILVGLSSSVFRACLMISLFYIFELLKRISNIYHSIALSAIVILLINPYEVYSIGFQLSYCAVFFLCWLAKPLSLILKTNYKGFNQWIINPLSVTLAAQLGTLPWVIFYFHQFSLLSIPFNFIIIPYSFIITYASIVELLFLYLPNDFHSYSAFIYDFLIKLLVNSTSWISSQNTFMYKNIPLGLVEALFLTFSCVSIRYIFKSPYKLKYFFPFLLSLIAFQITRLSLKIKNDYKKQVIVFHHTKTLVGLRNGNQLLILKDSTLNLADIQKHILIPYEAGERISNTEYRNFYLDRDYFWEGKIIKALNYKQLSALNTNKTTIIVSSFEPSIKKSNSHSIIISDSPATKSNDLGVPSKENVWITSKQGAYITSLP